MTRFGFDDEPPGWEVFCKNYYSVGKLSVLVLIVHDKPTNEIREHHELRKANTDSS